MKLTDKEIQSAGRLSRDRGLLAERKGVDLDALQELGYNNSFTRGRRLHRLNGSASTVEISRHE